MALTAIQFTLQFHAQTKKAIEATKGLDKGINSLFQTHDALKKSMAESLLGDGAGAIRVTNVLKSLDALKQKYMDLGSNSRFAELATRQLTEYISNSSDVFKNIGVEMGYTSEQLGVMGQEWDRVMLGIAKTDPSSAEIITEQFSKISETLGKLPTDKAMEFADATGEIYKKIEKGEGNINTLKSDLVDLADNLEEAAIRADKLDTRLKTIDGIKAATKSYGRLFVNATGLTTIFQSLMSVVSQQDRIFFETAKMGLAQYESKITSAGDAMRGVRQQGNDFMDSARKVAMATNSSLDDTSVAMSALMNNRSIMRGTSEASLESMTKTVTLMSHAFGVSAGEAAEFARAIVVIGGGTAKDLEGAATALGNVQTNLGLSAQSSRLVIQQVGLMIRQFKAFGATSSDIESVTKSVGSLVASFERVGLEAGEAQAILNKMMDPSQIGENALMWHGLNMTVQDGMAAMMGDASQLENLNERMVGMAVKLREQYGSNPIALQQMAQAYGMSMQQVMALSNEQRALGDGIERNMTLEEKAAANRASAAKEWEQVFNQLKNTIQALLIPVIKFITWATAWMVANPKLTKTIAALTIGIIALFKAIQLGSKLALGPDIFGQIKTGIQGITGVAKGATAGIKGMWGAFKESKGIFSGVDRLRHTLGGATSAVGATAKGAGGAASIANAAPAAGGVSKLGAAFKSFPSPATILALAAAIAAIGASVMGIVWSFSLLAKAMESFDFLQMIGFAIVALAIMIPLMIGLVAAIGALGAVGTVAGPGLMFVALAIIAIGAAVAGIILSFAVLIKAFTKMMDMFLNSDATFGQLVGIFAGLAAGILMVSYAALAATIAIPSLLLVGSALVLVSVGALAAGLAFKMLGSGMLNIGKGMELIKLNALAAKDALLDFMSIFRNGEFNKQAMEQINDLSKALAGFAAMGALMSLTSKITGPTTNYSSNTSPVLDKVVTELQTANEHLNKIEGFSKNTSEGIDKLVIRMGKQNRVQEFSV